MPPFIGILLVGALLLPSPARAGRCGPEWMPRGAKCIKPTCGAYVRRPRAGSSHKTRVVYGLWTCGYHERTLKGWTAMLPADLVEPFTTHQVSAALGAEGAGATEQVDGRIRLSETFAVRARHDSVVWPELDSGGEAGIVMNLPTGSTRIHLGVHATGTWRDGPGARAGMTAIAAPHWSVPSVYLTMEAGSESSAYFARGAAGVALIGEPFAMLVGSRFERRGDALAPAADLLVSWTPCRWLAALEGTVGSDWSVGVRLGRWAHPNPDAR